MRWWGQATRLEKFDQADGILTPGESMPAWRRVARWLLVLPVSAMAVIATYVSSQLLTVVTAGWIGEIDCYSSLNLSIHGLLSLQSVLEISCLCALWLVPTACAVAFAARWRWLTGLSLGFSASLVLTGMYVWTTQPGISRNVPHVAAILAGTLLLFGGGLSLRRSWGVRAQLLVEAVALVVLLLPCLVAIASAPRELPAPQKLWTVTLQKHTWDAMNTGSEFSATRHMALAGDRLVAVYEAGMAPYEGKQPMSEYALVSLDLGTGVVRNEKHFIGRWGATPSLYGAQGGNLVLAGSTLTLLHPDLTSAGSHFELSRGRVEQISPDGSTMAWETTPGITFLDTSTLTPTSTHLDASVATSVNRNAVLTDNISWFGAYPKESGFVTMTDAGGEHLLSHGKCGGRPAFLTQNLVYVGGCVLDLQGSPLYETNVAGNVRFAGVSQNGKRFALVVSESRGDPSVVLFEHFILFDTDTGRSLVTVRTEHLPDNQSWSAFSPDGTFFASGDASALSLYRIQ